MIVLLATGCYARTSIPPTELPVLNNALQQQARAGNVTFTMQTLRTVRRTDGRTVQIRGEHAAEVHPRSDEHLSVRFDHPVMAHVGTDGLHVLGGNRGEHVFPLEQISHVDVITHDPGLSALLTTLIVTLASGGAAAIALSIAFSL